MLIYKVKPQFRDLEIRHLINSTGYWYLFLKYLACS